MRLRVRPIQRVRLATTGNIYQYASAGIFRQNQIIANVNVHAGSKIWLFGYYVLDYANSDTRGANSFPSNQYDVQEDYGRATFAARNRLFMGGTIALPRAFRLSPFLIASSGNPYNITLQQDLNDDSIFNDRPGFVSSTACGSVQITGSIYCTPLGTFNSVPTTGERILPVNYATGPGVITLNARLSKTFGLGRNAAPGQGAAISRWTRQGARRRWKAIWSCRWRLRAGRLHRPALFAYAEPVSKKSLQQSESGGTQWDAGLAIVRPVECAGRRPVRQFNVQPAALTSKRHSISKTSTARPRFFRACCGPSPVATELVRRHHSLCNAPVEFSILPRRW